MVTATATVRGKSVPKRSLRIAHPLRAAVLVLACAVLAALLGLQALSNVLAYKSPEMAATLFPPNGLAREQVVALRMMSRIERQEQVPEVAREYLAAARDVISSEPLTPKAHAILALGAADESERERVLSASLALNRRDPLLLGAEIERRVQQGDYERTLAGIDRLLRVSPEQTGNFFPILGRALKDTRSVPAFTAMLDGSARWHRPFLEHTSSQDELLDSLTVLWRDLRLRDPALDRRLVARLAATGRDAAAFAVYRQSVGGGTVSMDGGELPWTRDFPPFDWRMAEESGLRGDPSPDGEKLDVFVRSGQGGIVAERVIRPPSRRFVVTLGHELMPVDQVRDVRLQLRCGSTGEPFYDERFEPGRNRFRIGNAPADCEFMTLAIHARAWSGRSPIRGTVDRITLAADRSAPEPAPAVTEEPGDANAPENEPAASDATG